MAKTLAVLAALALVCSSRALAQQAGASCDEKTSDPCAGLAQPVKMSLPPGCDNANLDTACTDLDVAAGAKRIIHGGGPGESDEAHDFKPYNEWRPFSPAVSADDRRRALCAASEGAKADAKWEQQHHLSGFIAEKDYFSRIMQTAEPAVKCDAAWAFGRYLVEWEGTYWDHPVDAASLSDICRGLSKRVGEQGNEADMAAQIVKMLPCADPAQQTPAGSMRGVSGRINSAVLDHELQHAKDVLGSQGQN